MFDAEGFILIGGASSRMGTNKARLRLAGHTFVERISEALSFVAEKSSVVGSARESVPWQLPIVEDVYNQWGALGGLHAALQACRAEWAIIVACDLPFVSAELFARLVHLRGDFEAVAPMQIDGRPQPLCALYRVNACLERTRVLIEAGERRSRSLLQAAHTRWVTSDELADLKNATLFFLNVNTPQDYARAQAAVSKNASEE